jgi:hypothetical protein
MKLTVFLIAVCVAAQTYASDVSWIFLPGYYTHRDGHRVAQYEPEKPSYVTVDPTYQQSGYHHQSFGDGANRYDIYESWGDPSHRATDDYYRYRDRDYYGNERYHPRPYPPYPPYYGTSPQLPETWRTPVQGPASQPTEL